MDRTLASLQTPTAFTPVPLRQSVGPQVAAGLAAVDVLLRAEL
jgi:hypothetical protein